MRFYFDYISPYAYLAWRQLPAIAARHGEAIEPIPVLFGAMLSAHGTKGPAEVPAKRRYLIADVYRKAQLAGLPFTLPPAHPFNPLLALRATAAPMPDADRVRLIDALYAAVWESGHGIEAPGSVARAASAAGLDGPAVEAAAASPDAKAALRAHTDAAIAAGLFGVPTITVSDAMFWGVDSLPALDRFLSDRAPIPADLLARWDALPATATRRP